MYFGSCREVCSAKSTCHRSMFFWHIESVIYANSGAFLDPVLENGKSECRQLSFKFCPQQPAGEHCRIEHIERGL